MISIGILLANKKTIDNHLKDNNIIAMFMTVSTTIIIIFLFLNSLAIATPEKRTYTWSDAQEEIIEYEEPLIEKEQELSHENNVQRDVVEREEVKDIVYESRILLSGPREKTEVERQGKNNGRIIKVDITPWEIENRKAQFREKVREEQLEKIKSYVQEGQGGIHEEM